MRRPARDAVRSPLLAVDPGARDASPRAPRSLVAAHEHWIAPGAVRQAIGAWAYTLGPSERRPSEQAVREAVAVACAVRELSTRAEHTRWTTPGDAEAPSPGDAVRLDVAALTSCAGLGAREVVAAVALLERVGVLTRHVASGDASVRLGEHVLTPQPGPSRVAWEAVRSRVRGAGGSVGPALAVLRELAAALGAAVAGPDLAPVRLSVRDLEERTGFGRSTVAESLDVLARVRLLDVESRAGRTARFTLRPAAFGLPDEVPAPTASSESRGTPAKAGRVRPWEPPPAPPSAPPADEQRARRLGTAAAVGAATGPGAPATAPVLVGEFAGTPIYGPPGTPLVVACDAEGRWTCQVGPFLRLGPAGG